MNLATYPNTAVRTASRPPRNTVTLTQEDVYRIPQRYQAVRVLQGKAWLSHNGRDAIINAGEQTSIIHVDAALISMLGRTSLMIELLEDKSR